MMKSKLFYTILGIVIAACVLLFGQGIIMRPKISISCGAIDYKIPAKYQLELFMWKMMMVAEDVEKEMSRKMTVLLREYDFPEEKIKLIMARLTEKKAKLSDIDLHLKPHEENIIKAVIAKLSSEVLSDTMMKSLQLPDAALFFEIKNTGFASAHNAHIVIRLKGTSYNVLKNSDNKLKESVEKGSELSFDYEHIAPNSKIKGIVWYSHIKHTETLEDNLISVSFDGGTVRQSFSEDNFYLSPIFAKL